MDALTKYEALLGELEPYAPSGLTLKKALADAGVDDSSKEYAPETDKKTIARAAIKVLQKMIVLTSDSLGKSSRGYDVNKLTERIKNICTENGFDSSDFVQASSVTDGSNLW